MSASLSESMLPSTLPILGSGRCLWGELEAMRPIGEGLLHVVISGMEYLVPDSLQEKLAGLVGKKVSIVHIAPHWGCAERSA